MSNTGPSGASPLDPQFTNPLDSTNEEAIDLSFLATLDPSVAQANSSSTPNPTQDDWDILDEFLKQNTSTDSAPPFPEEFLRPVLPLFSTTTQSTAPEQLPMIPTVATASTSNVSKQLESHAPQSSPNIQAVSYISLQPQRDQNSPLEKSSHNEAPRKKTKHEKICQQIEDIDHELESLRENITDAKKEERAELSSCNAKHELTASSGKINKAKTAKSQIRKIKNKFSARISRLNIKIEDLKRDKLSLKKDLEILRLRQQIRDLQEENEQLRALQGDPIAPQQSPILWQSTSARAVPAPEAAKAKAPSKRTKVK